MKADSKDIYELMNILNKFQLTSRQRVNIKKSGLIFKRKVPRPLQNRINQNLGIPRWEELGKYLGIPAQWVRSKSATLTWLKDAIFRKMDRWQDKLLNQA